MSDISLGDSNLNVEKEEDVNRFSVRAFVLNGKVCMYLIEDGVLVYREGHTTYFRPVKK